ncbi:MAG: hypothetical protein SOH69_01165 [Olsenella sp.]
MSEGIAQGGRADELEDLVEVPVRLKDAVPVLNDASVATSTQQLVLCEVPCRAARSSAGCAATRRRAAAMPTELVAPRTRAWSASSAFRLWIDP